MMTSPNICWLYSCQMMIELLSTTNSSAFDIVTIDGVRVLRTKRRSEAFPSVSYY